VKPSGKVKFGFAWFRPEQWSRLRQVSADREELEETLAEWESRAEETLGSLQAQGMNIERVIVDVEEVLAGCKHRGLPFDANARSHYVADLLRKWDLH
jgi:hypothetical protein